jgi:Mg2+ and Co2+ transporter CorA
MGKVIAAAAYSNGRKVADIRIDESSQWATRPDHFVWIGFEAPDENDLRLLQAQFGLHELAIEDALHAHQRPKIETYGETTFVALRTAFLAEGHIAFGETEIFVGRGYVISVRHGGSASYAPVRQRAEASPKRLAQGEDYVLYAIVDFIADNYLTVVEKLADEIEALEDHVLEPLEEGRIYRIYELRRELQRLRLAAVSGDVRKSVLRSFVCTALGGNSEASILLGGCHDAAAQEVETGAAVHGALDNFQPVDLALDWTGAPGQRQGGMDGFDILTEAPRETFEAAVFGGADPSVELVGQSLPDHGRETPG